MIKFKILSLALRALVCFYITGIICLLYFIYTFSGNPIIPQSSINGFYISIASMLLFATGLYFLQKSCSMFLKRTYFNLKSEIYLKRGGYIVMASALFGFVMTIIDKPLEPKKNLFSDFTLEISYNTTLLIFGFAIIAVADIIKKGRRLKTENDLTI